MTKKFVPISDVGKLTETERNEYYHNACDHFNIPPELNLLQFLWLDGGDGGRKLVLYALRGATDILRANRGISINKMTQTNGDGYVLFTAEGSDKTGRTDVAVGAAWVKGMTGKNLVDGILTAQTRASRRLTLQMVGGGLLDEIEVLQGSVTTDLSGASAPLSQIAAEPAVEPNISAGKDITESITVANYNGVPGIKADTPVQQNPPKEGVSLHLAPTREPDIQADAEPKRKGRRRKQADESWTPFEAPKNKLSLSDDIPESPRTTTPPAQPVIQIPTAQPVVSSIIEEKLDAPPNPESATNFPSPEQKAEFRKRIAKFRADILEPAGMTATENIGGVVVKLRMFARALFKVETDQMTLAQWDEFFQTMQENIDSEGAGGLIKYIHRTIGVAE